MNILDKIVQRKREELEFLKKNIPLQQVQDSDFFDRKTFSLKETLKKKSGIIAEFKRKSPSKGIINCQVSPSEVASDYEKYGASAISILTDQDFFGGSSEDIVEVRKSINIPILRKDFMIDEYQFYEAKSMGADVVLLIAACLSVSQARDFTDLAHQLGLEVLLEIHSESELKYYNSDVDMVGINNRNLKNFDVNLKHSIQLKNQLPENVLSVAESGIYSVEDFKYLKEKGFDGFLMGEFFMKKKNPGNTFSEFIAQINR